MAGRYGLSAAALTVVFAVGYVVGPLVGAAASVGLPFLATTLIASAATVVASRSGPRGRSPDEGRRPRLWPRGQGGGSHRVGSVGSAVPLFTDYEVDGFFDEMFEAPDRPRDTYRRLYSGLSTLRPSTFAARSALVDRAYLTQGITFDHGGRERPFPFDLLPRLIPASEWARLDAGLSQRVRALDRFVADVYGQRRAVADGVVPNGLVSPPARATCGAMIGVEPPLGRFVHVAGIDLVRDDDGVWRVLEDNLRCPSGLSYVVQNRAFMRRAFPEAFGDHHVEPVGHAPFLLLSALIAAAPEGRASPRVVLLTPGPANAGLLRALLPRPADGGAPGGGARPGGARPARLPAHHRGPRARRRHLPAHRRRLPRPGQPAQRLAAGRRRPDAGLPRGERGRLQRHRDRRGRRQGGLRLRARPDPVLPRRGADALAGADLPAGARGGPVVRARQHGHAWW